MKKIFQPILLLAIVAFFASCSDDGEGTLDMNLKLEYQDAPLVMLQDYEYPDGRKIQFTRISFYYSDLKLGERTLNDIEYLNLSNHFSETTTAAEGYSLKFDNIPNGDYAGLSFDIGISPEDNAKVPGDFESGHPLALAGEHWPNWSSYIFMKVEGKIDMDNDGTSLEQSFALHLGADSALRSINLTDNIEIKSDETTRVNLAFNLYEFFGGASDTYDIDSNPQLHSLSQEPQVVELADNLANMIAMK